MPSVTVVVSSDTDIYISPGLYGDCLPTVSTDGAADSFRAGPSLCPRRSLHARTCPRRRSAAVEGRSGTGIHVTPTLWTSSK
ncbi:hypothetical protein GTY88_25220 [Streptomyces sp. SID5926]|nr:hypothetical protein [Streptomyces sp. SID5926]